MISKKRKNKRKKSTLTNKEKQILIGLKLSLILFTNARAYWKAFYACVIAFLPYFVIFLFMKINGGTQNIFETQTLLIMILFVALFSLILSIHITSKNFQFNIRKGTRIFIKTSVFKAPMTIFVVFLIFFLLFCYVRETQLTYLSTKIFFSYNISFAFILFFPTVIFITLLIGEYNRIRPSSYLTYIINTIKSRKKFFNKKIKIYHLLLVIYRKYGISMKNYYGYETSNVYSIDNILRLAIFVSLLDENEKGKMDKVKTFCQDLKKIDCFNNTKEWVNLMNDINSLTKKINVDIELIKKKYSRENLKQKLLSFALLLSIVGHAFNLIFNYLL